MKMGKMYVLVGHIASGKSSYCKNAAKVGQIILNDDAIVNLLHADDYTLYDKNLKILYKSIETSILSLGLCLGKSIIIDRGLNVSIKGRQRWLALAKSYDVECHAIIMPMDTPQVHAERRTKHDARGHDYNYWLDVAKTHVSVYNAPSIEEGFDKIHCLGFSQILNGKVIDD
jgi:predicted kinase